MRRLMTLTLLLALLVAGGTFRQVTLASALSFSRSPVATKVCTTKTVHGKKKKVRTTTKPKPTAPSTLSLAQQVDHLLTTKSFSGSILLEKGGQMLLEKSYGMADRASKTPNTPQTKLPIFGINAFLAAIRILKLQETPVHAPGSPHRFRRA